MLADATIVDAKQLCSSNFIFSSSGMMLYNFALVQRWANYGPRAKFGRPVLLFWPAGTYTNLNSHRELSGRPFFPLEIMDGSDFQKNKPQPCKIGIKNEKNEVRTFYFGDHISTWTVISKKKVFTFFSNQHVARGLQIWPFV